ncbi:hypothetical protein [Leptospira idonii]|nr:hypothetical protein [Leptospira idonii]
MQQTKRILFLLSFCLVNFSLLGEDTKEKQEPSSDKKEMIVEFTSEIVTDFLWRGNSLAGESLKRRNGDSYESFTYAPAFQPTVDFFSHDRKFQLQLFGNFQLNQREDRDSDKRLFQSGSGGVGPSYLGEDKSNWDPHNQDLCAQTLQSGAMGMGGNLAECGSRVPGKDVAPYKEPNGMKRSDGLFVVFTYHFDATKFGQFSGGIWFYNTFHKSPSFLLPSGTQTANPYAAGGTGFPYGPNTMNANNRNAITRLTWHEYFIVWKLPFLRSLSPTLSYFTQYSTENGGYMTGRNYVSFQMNHEFRKEKFFRIQPSVNVGYAMGNNALDNRSGIQDITSSVTFHFGQFFLKAVNIYRPDLYLWDSNNYYGFAGGDPGRASWNRTSEDGLVPNPNKMYGPVNSYILNTIDSFQSGNPALDSVAKIWAREKFTLQKIPQFLFYFSIGYTATF